MKKSIYLDHAATTPLAPEVLEAMLPWLTDFYWNPGGMYNGGFRAKNAVAQARETVAGVLNCRPEEIIFTSGGSEANNLALRGVMGALPQSGHLVTSAIEHHSILHTAEDLKREGHALSVLPVTEEGIVSHTLLEEKKIEGVSLLSVMMANNEVGTIQRISVFAEVLSGLGKDSFFHVDAVQGGAYLDLDVKKLGVDLLSLSGHKFYGPRGTGALFVKAGTPLKPQITGGRQEGGRRAGTENVAGIIGFAKALQLASERREKESARLSILRDHMIQRIHAEIPHTRTNGASVRRLPNNVNVSFWGVEGESILLFLNEEGVCASTGSACASEDLGVSHVIAAIGRAHEWAHGSMRFSLGRATTKDEIDFTVDVLKKSVERLRALSPIPQNPPN